MCDNTWTGYDDSYESDNDSITGYLMRDNVIYHPISLV